jgi:hypothetical protein
MSDFDDALILIRLASDPDGYKARLEELRSTIAAADEATAEAQVEQQKLATERLRLEAMLADLCKREAAVKLAVHQNASDLAAIHAWKRDRANDRLVKHMGGLTSEPDDTPVDPDPITDRYAESMTPPAAVRAAPRHKSRARG